MSHVSNCSVTKVSSSVVGGHLTFYATSVVFLMTRYGKKREAFDDHLYRWDNRHDRYGERPRAAIVVGVV